ncbi:hypothetical protein CXZ10_01415 [Pleomorphomonas diazotrophica]|uniref:Probable membrane transporter protein n=1 Tax=Pleomorphomonas diazotrophica TaxID=1166257 RepID=A0A1I4VFQ4_9HYPH|nr:TSUP family transporter [Pleomorphomonas diazotrophica]PKR90078.1 hypothetical protein CXZ10_01415 [Pleomorphomonas diazotrophica]SFN00005.1 hypothetical protein SAMN05192571_11195 [Pleomorphomonas diazotrophica]
MADLSLHILTALFFAALLAGFIDSIAGGGGLITVPALMLAGLTPIQSLGTNKLQSLFGSASATMAYARAGQVNLRSQLPMALMSGGGSILGALLATVLPGDWLRVAMPVMLVAIAVYFAFKRGLNDQDRQARMTPFLFTLVFVPVIGCYDGLFGPGTGSFFMLGFVSLAGFGLLKATAHTKLLNFASNVGSFVVFVLSGVVIWKAGLVMGAGQFLGAQMGSRLAVRGGARIIRPLLVITCIGLAIRLLADPANPVRVWVMGM